MARSPCRGLPRRIQERPLQSGCNSRSGPEIRAELAGEGRKIPRQSEASPLNYVSGKGDLGIITSGVSYLNVLDAVTSMGLEEKVKILKLGFTFPQPKAVISEFLSGVNKALVVEELEPFIEEAVRSPPRNQSCPSKLQAKAKD